MRKEQQESPIQASFPTKPNAQQLQAMGQVLHQQMSTSGPLPVASEFAGYENALHGAADRILAMAEKEASERHLQTRILVRSQVFQNYSGPIAGFIVAILSLYLGYNLTKSGFTLAGFSSIAIAALSMAGSIFAAFRRSHR